MRRSPIAITAVLVLLLLAPVACSTVPPQATLDACATQGCPIRLATNPRPPGPSDGCILMSVEGTVVRHSIYGLGLEKSNGAVRGVLWPFGWSARWDSDRVALVNRAGKVVAREGDHISLSGGGTKDYDFICDPEFEAGG